MRWSARWRSALLKGLRHTDPDRMADFAGWLMRTIGPLLPEQRVARDNLKAAFPEKSAAEIESNPARRLGQSRPHGRRIRPSRPAVGFRPGASRPARAHRTRPPRTSSASDGSLHDGKPALIFAAHLANWELPAICAATYELDSAVLYRRPNIAGIDRWLRETRAASMGELISAGLEAPLKLADALQRGAHVGMLVDQYYVRGVEVTFFGRRTMANPLLARLARHFDCPIHGVRIVRLPGHRFRGEITEEIAPARDAQGKIDIAGTMQIITSVVEGWIREHPEQWLWQHRRWRPEDAKTA